MERIRKVPKNYLTNLMNQNIRVKRAPIPIVTAEIDPRHPIETMQVIKKILLVVTQIIQQNQRSPTQETRTIGTTLQISTENQITDQKLLLRAHRLPVTGKIS